VVSNDATINTHATTTSITPSSSKLKSKYPLFKGPIQPKIPQELPNVITLLVAIALIQVVGLKSTDNQKVQKQDKEDEG
jgi:hypothetical protein